jgi:hypothetical protein
MWNKERLAGPKLAVYRGIVLGAKGAKGVEERHLADAAGATYIYSQPFEN